MPSSFYGLQNFDEELKKNFSRHPTSPLSSTQSLSSLNSSSLLMGDSVPRYDRGHEEEPEGIFIVNDQQQTSVSHKTTAWQSFIHLLKGNVGPGCLSLPWAFSQLGITRGAIACVILAYWSSYNGWSVVLLRRHLQDERDRERNMNESRERIHDPLVSVDEDTPVDAQEPERSLINYPDLGAWAYGKSFKNYVTLCICTQQLAVCTVFFSFIGENVLVVLGHLEIADPSDSWSHTLVLLCSLPPILALACLPDLKALAPVMMFATVLLMGGFGLLLTVAGIEWADRHGTDGGDDNPNDEYLYSQENLRDDSSPSPYSVPLALCAILYSFEGICLLFPVESSMARPRKEFGWPVYVPAMICVPLIYVLISSACVTAFGEVTNGSITAFLLEGSVFRTLTSDWSRSLLLLANTVVTVSVLLTYPLQLYPALELLGPWWAGGEFNTISNNVALDDESAAGTSIESPTVSSRPQRTAFVRVSSEDEDEEGRLRPDSSPTPGSATAGPRLDRRETSLTLATNGDGSAIVADGDEDRSRTFHGDSPQLRLALVTLTFVVAVAIPNVQALISLAGALAGSSIALLIPPLLELAYQKRVVQDDNVLARIRCYGLLALGVLFLVIGTSASVLDIVAIYRTG